VSGQAQARSHERVLRICASETDSRTLRSRVLAEIRRVIAFDAYVWLLTDPETSVGSSPLADVPCLPELPRLIKLKYLTGVNRWTHLDRPVALLHEATDGDLSRSFVWRELLHHFGISDVASSVFRDTFGCWAFLDLWRVDAPDAFSAADAAYLAGIAAPVTTALRRCHATTFAATTFAAASFAAATAQGTQRRGPVVLLLSADLDVLAQTPETAQHLRLLLPPDIGRSPIPASAYNVAAQLLAAEQGVDAHAATARVHRSDGRWLTLRAARIEDGRPAADRDIAVTVEDSSPAERTSLFARVHGLSVRETELLSHLVAGGDTRDIAGLMSVSRHTVQDHLKSIFAKSSVRNRRTLLSRALGG